MSDKDEFQKCYVKQKKPDRKEYALYYSIYVKCKSKKN